MHSANQYVFVCSLPPRKLAPRHIQVKGYQAIGVDCEITVSCLVVFDHNVKVYVWLSPAYSTSYVAPRKDTLHGQIPHRCRNGENQKRGDDHDHYNNFCEPCGFPLHAREMEAIAVQAQGPQLPLPDSSSELPAASVISQSGIPTSASATCCS